MTDYYINHSGNDANTGTSEAAAWRTIQHGVDNITSVDVLWIKADQDYKLDGSDQPAAPITIGWSGGTPQYYYKPCLLGYTSTPGDNGRAVIDAMSTQNYCIDGGTYSWWVVKNFELKNAVLGGLHCLDGNGFYWNIDNIYVYACGNEGIRGFGNSMIRNCYIDNCTYYGVRIWPGTHVIGCVVGNVQYGIMIGNNSLINNCIVKGCSVYGVYASGSRENTVIGCTVYNCNNGIGILGYAPEMVINNIIVGSTGFGLGWQSANPQVVISDHNCYYNNNKDFEWDAVAGPNDIFADPKFTDPANGDFSLLSGSPCRAIGWPGAFPDGINVGKIDIGAVQYHATKLTIANVVLALTLHPDTLSLSLS